MSRSVNRVTLIGNAGADPRVTETEKGTRVAHVSLATNRVFTVDGEEEQRTDWHRLTFWGRSADTVERYLRKGTRLYVDGRIEYGSYEKEGVTVPSVDIVVRDFVLLDPRENGGRRSDGEGAGVGEEDEAEEEAGLGV